MRRQNGKGSGSAATDLAQSAKHIDNEPDFSTLAAAFAISISEIDAIRQGLIDVREIPANEDGCVYTAVRSEIDFVYAIRIDRDNIGLALGVETARIRNRPFRMFLADLLSGPAINPWASRDKRGSA